MNFISLSNVSKSYKEGEVERPILQDVSLDVRKGEIIIVLGRSGSGKSTLLNILSGIDTIQSGKIIVDSEEISGISEHERTVFRRKNIGFVFQFFNLLPTLSVWDNILLPLELNGMLTKENLNFAEQLLSEVGLLHRKEAFPDKLSGGEQQRVAIARALVHKPKLILADEPTGNLDSETGKSILALLDSLIRAQGMTMMMATHSREVMGIADRIITVKGGKLHEISLQEMQ